MAGLFNSVPYVTTVATFLVAFAFASSRFVGRHVSVRDEAHSGDRLGHIDGLRGYLAIAVLAHHFMVWTEVTAGLPWSAPDSMTFNNLGQAGVAVFFMITGALFYARLSQRPSGTNWTSFYINRVFRLTPLLWMAVLLVNIIVFLRVGLALPEGPWAYLGNLAKWLTFAGTPDLAGYRDTDQIVAKVTWSLTYEWGFYLCLPLLAAVLAYARRRGIPSAAIPILLLGPAIGLIGSIAYKVNLGLGTLFVLGMLAIEVRRSEAAVKWLRTRYAALIGAVSLMVELTSFGTSFELPQYVLLSLFFFPVIAGNDYFGLLSRRGSLILGEASYSIYLLHGIVLNLFFVSVIPTLGIQSPMASWLFAPAVGVVVVALSITTYRLVELPGISFGKRLGRRLSRRAERQENAVARGATAVKAGRGVLPQLGSVPAQPERR